MKKKKAKKKKADIGSIWNSLCNIKLIQTDICLGNLFTGTSDIKQLLGKVSDSGIVRHVRQVYLCF